MEEVNSPNVEIKNPTPFKKIWSKFSSQKIGIKVSLAAFLIALIILPFMTTFVSNKHSPENVSTHAQSTNTSSVSYSVVGNKILSSNGTQFAPYGFVLECLGRNDINALCKPSAKDPNTDSDKIKAIATFWHGNTVRLQVAQENLFHQLPYDTTFLSMIDNEVTLANSLGMVVIITLQEEEYKGPPFPTQSAINFWQFMAGHYKNNPSVFFDLYNEPRLTVNEAGNESNLWNIWQNGGTVGSTYYVGFQALVNTIRGQGANNIIIAESNLYDKDLTQLSTHYLTGANIAYGVEPNLYKDSRTPQQWYTNFGQYTKAVPIMPEAFRDNVGLTCDPNSPTDVPMLFNYLTSIHMGAIVWTLAPGISTTGSSLTTPTTYNGLTTIQCPAGLSDISPNNNVGPGQDILSFFEANSSGSGKPQPTTIISTLPTITPAKPHGKGKHHDQGGNQNQD